LNPSNLNKTTLAYQSNDPQVSCASPKNSSKFSFTPQTNVTYSIPQDGKVRSGSMNL